MPVKGTYCLCINIEEDISIKVGALGKIYFPRGSYIYVGSALNSLLPRLKRHLKNCRGEHDVTHWHIDYLLKDPNVSIETIYINDNGEKLECSLAAIIAERGEPTPRFGCSDCKCLSHLYRADSFGFLKKMGLKKYV